MLLDKRLTLAGSALILSAVAIFLRLHRDTSNTNGWVTLKAAQQEFQAELLLNGVEIPRYHLILIEPEITSQRTVKLSETYRFTVRVQLIEGGIPPTFVFVKFLKRKKNYSSTRLLPTKHSNSEFFFSEEVEAPDQLGDYEIVIVSEYVTIGKEVAADGSPSPYRKLTKEGILHVRK